MVNYMQADLESYISMKRDCRKWTVNELEDGCLNCLPDPFNKYSDLNEGGNDDL